MTCGKTFYRLYMFIFEDNELDENSVTEKCSSTEDD